MAKWWLTCAFGALVAAATLAAAVSMAAPSGARAGAPTNVSGTISSDTTWTPADSPYIVTGHVFVSQGVTLTIEPGVTVRFQAIKTLQVDGTLIARGAPTSPITFTSDAATPAKGDWGSIIFSDTK